MKFNVFDIEADGLYDSVSTIHCLSYAVLENNEVVEKKSITSKSDIIAFFEKDGYFVGHNVIRYDFPVMWKLLGAKTPKNIIDTLGVSWYLFPENKIHGLEHYGRIFNVPKPIIKDWKNLSLDDYIHRCEEDVEINIRLFKYQFNYLFDLYKDTESVFKICHYLNFKLDCLLEQEMNGIPLDLYTCKKSLKTVEYMLLEKTKVLSETMPNDLGRILKTKPKVLYKKDGSLSVHGEKWFNLLEEKGLPDDTEVIREDPNPGSTDQMKAWLHNLGWKPQTFKVSKATGKKVEQLSLPFGGGLCPSVTDLFEKEPMLKEYNKYSIIKHRIGVLQGFLDDYDYKTKKIYASANGFTNTLRLKHSKPVVNLPKPSLFFGEEIRSCLHNPDEDYVMCGSDVSSLEDSTKQHYIYFFDPKYVEEMRVPGFDPHIDIGKLAELISKEEVEFYKHIESLSKEEKENLSSEDVENYKSIKKRRTIAKQANFAATYGAGGPKIAETAKITLDAGYNLHKIYWQRNKAIKEVEKSVEIIEISYKRSAFKYVDKVDEETGEILKEKEYIFINSSQKWVKNPISGFYMYLKSEKDVFSTVNQSSGVAFFDMWLKEVRKHFANLKIPIVMQYHDEIMFICKKEDIDVAEKILRKSAKKVNKLLNLNIEIGISVDWGNSYSEVH